MTDMYDPVLDEQRQPVQEKPSSRAGGSNHASPSIDQLRANNWGNFTEITQEPKPPRTLEPDPRIGPSKHPLDPKRPAEPKQASLPAVWDRGFSDDPCPGDHFFRRGLPVAKPHVTIPVINEIPPTPICSPPSAQHSLNKPNTSQVPPTSPRPNQSPSPRPVGAIQPGPCVEPARPRSPFGMFLAAAQDVEVDTRMDFDGGVATGNTNERDLSSARYKKAKSCEDSG